MYIYAYESQNFCNIFVIQDTIWQFEMFLPSHEGNKQHWTLSQAYLILS